jgi:hypothetical protein
MAKYQRLRDLRAKLGLFNLREFAEAVGMSAKWCLAHREQWPGEHIGGHFHRVWTKEDVASARAWLDRVPARRTDPIMMAREAAGLYSAGRAADLVGLTRITWRKALDAGKIPRPSHRVGPYWYYTAEEAWAIHDTHFALNKPPPGWFASGEAADLVGMPRQRWRYYARLRWPDLGKRAKTRSMVFYSPDDIDEIRKRMATN